MTPNKKLRLVRIYGSLAVAIVVLAGAEYVPIWNVQLLLQITGWVFAICSASWFFSDQDMKL